MGQLSITIWAATMFLFVATLMVGHWASLPHPEVGERFPNIAVQDVGFNGEEIDVQAFHFLYVDCPCSRRVIRHLSNRTPLDGAIENVVFVGDTLPNERIHDGFNVELLSPVELKQRYGIESAPLLVVTDSVGTITYSGGYTSRKQGPDIQDVEIISAAVKGTAYQKLPVFGCAVSNELKSLVDPLGIKYETTKME